MSASLLYRIVAVLLVLYAAGHQIGFWQVDPSWGVDGVPPEVLRSLQLVAWAFAAAFVAATYITWRYFFTAPVVFSSLVTLGLIAAAWKGR